MRNRKHICLIFFAAVILQLLSSTYLSAQESMTISLSDDTIEFNETVTVTLTATVKDFKFYAELPGSEGYYVSEDLSENNYAGYKQFINVTQSFTLSPQKAGTFYVGRAWIQSGSKRVFSNQLTLTIKPKEEPTAAKNFFIYAQPAKTKVFVGQELEVKVWAFCLEGNSFQPSSDGPTASGYNGFWHYDGSYNSTIPYDKKTVTIKGKKYIGFPIFTEFLYPHSTGRIALPVYDYFCTVSDSPFAEYDDYSDYYTSSIDNEVERKTDSVFIISEPLPANGRPANFLGDIGNFVIESSVDKTDLKAYESITLTITVSGAGNISTLQIPEPVFPAGFEHFAPLTANETVQTEAGIIGTKSFTYNLIPTQPGDFTLDGIGFSYYDAGKKEYISLKPKEIMLHVGPGKPNLPDTAVSNLPDGFLSPESPVKNVLTVFVVVVVPLAILGTLLFFWLRKRKRRLEKEKSEMAIEEKPAPPPGIEFRKMLSNAEHLFAQRNVRASLHILYEALHSAISKKCELDRPEASISQIRYRLATKKFEQTDIDQLTAFLERCSLIKYSWASQNPETIRKILSDASGFLTKLGY